MLLIVDLDKHIGNARAWPDTFGEQLPDLEISARFSTLADAKIAHHMLDGAPHKPGKIVLKVAD